MSYIVTKYEIYNVLHLYYFVTPTKQSLKNKSLTRFFVYVLWTTSVLKVGLEV